MNLSIAQKGAFRKPEHFTVPYLTKARMKRFAEFWDRVDQEFVIQNLILSGELVLFPPINRTGRLNSPSRASSPKN